MGNFPNTKIVIRVNDLELGDVKKHVFLTGKQYNEKPTS